MKLYTIGFTRKTAEAFFEKLRKAGVRKIIDVRLNNVSQLAGFAKKEDLRYFLKAICAIDYVHLTELAPTQELLDAYKKGERSWDAHEKLFLALIKSRRIEKTAAPDIVDGSCLLCSEDEPSLCHRRLVAEYLQSKWRSLEIAHL